MLLTLIHALSAAAVAIASPPSPPPARGTALSLDASRFARHARAELKRDLQLEAEPSGRIVLQDLVSAADWAAGAFAQTFVAYVADGLELRINDERIVPAYVQFLQKEGSHPPRDGKLWLLSLDNGPSGAERAWPVDAGTLMMSDARMPSHDGFAELKAFAWRLRGRFPHARVEIRDTLGMLSLGKLRPADLLPALALFLAESARQPDLVTELNPIMVHLPWIQPPLQALGSAPVCLASLLEAIDETMKSVSGQCFVHGIEIPRLFRPAREIPGCRREIPVCDH